MTPRRPALRWHGGKWKLAPWIMSHFPKHRVYVEPFGGAASVLLRKERSHEEVYNDMDDDVVNFFRVLQDQKSAERLRELLALTPFARREFEIAWGRPKNKLDRARKLVIRSFMGFGSNAHNSMGRGHKTTGFRSNSSRSGTTPAHDWVTYADLLPEIVARLRGVVIEHRPAVKVMARHDAATTLHFADPPYMPDTRSPANKYDLKHRMYRYEMTPDDHRELLTFLRTLKGMVVLSGYEHSLYDELLPDWRKDTVPALADGARPRTEVVWLNPACADALDRQHAGHDAPLFAGSAA